MRDNIVLASGLFLVLLSSLFWLSRIQKLNKNLKQKQEVILNLSDKLKVSEAEYQKMAEELESNNSRLQEVAYVDSLSGLRNRYFFNQRINEEIERANRYGSALSLLMIDMDHFKRINDTYGHNAGDEVIRKVSEALQSAIRKVDILARWGGEEFVVLLPEIGLEDALAVGEKLRQKVASLIHFGKETVTISIGVSSWTVFDTPESWINRSDQALYHAKQEGRNRVCVSEGSEPYIREILVWDPSWESGNSVIDQEHKTLIAASNELITLILQSDMKLSIFEKLAEILKAIENHFTDEEQILKQMHYAELGNHIKCHHQLLHKAEALLQKSAEGRLLPSDVVRFIVGDMITIHLLQEDTKYFSLFKETEATN